MSVRDFFSDLGVTLPGAATAGSVSVRCFANPAAHKHNDRSPSCSVSLDTGQWCCHGCDAKGSAFDAGVALGRSRPEAAELTTRHELFATNGEHIKDRSAKSRRARSAGVQLASDNAA